MATQKSKLTPDHEAKAFEFAGQTFGVKRKFMIGRFLKVLNTSPVDAIEIVLEPDSFEAFLDLEMDMDDLKEFLNRMSNALSGDELKN